MKKRSKRWKVGRLGKMGMMALVAGAASAAGAMMIRGRKMRRRKTGEPRPASIWARPGMKVVFRAELKPGAERLSRTFQVLEVLPSGRVLLEGIAGEHAENEFEPIRQ